jgi:adenylylsulfate kinase
MNTVESRPKPAFAVWITGLPASGKSSIAALVKRMLEARGIDIAVLESDALRRVLTPQPRYDARERDLFYSQMVFIGGLLTDHGVPVIFDATANRRMHREWARQRISQFMEAYVECPLEVCMARDPKGIYRKALERMAGTVPGLQDEYEPPERPDLLVRGDLDAPETAARRVVRMLEEKGCILAPSPAAR